MPRSWYDRHAVNAIEDEEVKSLYNKIVADKKPYFMKMIYPNLHKQYNAYIKNTNKSCMREFNMSINELLSIPECDLTDEKREFIKYYKIKMPVSNNDCVMNKICKIFEAEFDGYIGRYNATSTFDYNILKSGVTYSDAQRKIISKLYDNYNARLRSYAIMSSYERIDECDSFLRLAEMKNEFIQSCVKVCQNRYELCDIILDICYNKSSAKKFAWEICGDEIIENLLNKSNMTIHYPELDVNGDISFDGKLFSLKNTKIGVDQNDCA